MNPFKNIIKLFFNIGSGLGETQNAYLICPRFDSHRTTRKLKKVSQRAKVLRSLDSAENLSVVSSNHVMKHNHYFSSRGPMPFSDPCGHQECKHTCRQNRMCLVLSDLMYQGWLVPRGPPPSQRRDGDGGQGLHEEVLGGERVE